MLSLIEHPLEGSPGKKKKPNMEADAGRLAKGSKTVVGKYDSA